MGSPVSIVGHLVARFTRLARLSRRTRRLGTWRGGRGLVRRLLGGRSIAARRRLALVWALRALSRRRQATDLDAFAGTFGPAAPEVPFKEIVTPAA